VVSHPLARRLPEAQAAIQAGQAFATLDAWLDEMARDVPPERTVVVGFSQGTMMALQVGLRRRRALAGIVGFSGRLLRPERLAAEIASKPPVLLVHGDQDQLVPVKSLTEASDALRAAGVETLTHVSRGVGHGIGPDGIRLALGFVQKRLGVLAAPS
jgi:phospholipase/carboxylesterase